jgi:hypothetical protein
MHREESARSQYGSHKTPELCVLSTEVASRHLLGTQNLNVVTRISANICALQS